MTERPELTKRQREIYDFIAERINACGYAPTIREIGAQLGIRSTNGVADHLKALKRKGYLSQAASKSRTWRPLHTPAVALPTVADAAPQAVPTVRVPILGRVAAGEPLLAEEQAEGSLQVDPSLLPRGRHIFALTIVGDSMIGVGINDGDIIFVEKRQDAPVGSIIVALIDDEATCKQYFPEGDRVRLQPANDSMAPLMVYAAEARDLQVIGVVVGVFHRF